MAAQFRLQPCRVVDNKIAQLSEDPITFEWSSLKAKLAPTSSRQALLTLRNMRRGCYLGLIKHPQTSLPTTFRLDLPPGTNNISWLLKHDRTVGTRIMEIYLVQDFSWEDTVQEFEGPRDE